MTKSILVGYKNVNIFQIYFSIKKNIEQVQNITFVEKYENNTLFPVQVNSLLPKESFNSVIPDGFIIPNISVNLINLNHYISLLSIHKPLPLVSNTFSTLSKLPDKIQFHKIEPLRQNQCKRQAPNRYGAIVISMDMSVVITKEFQEPLTFKQELTSRKAEMWK